MKILKELKTVIIIAITMIYSSCNFLNVDEYFNDMIPLDTIFARQELLERYIWGASALLPNEGELYSNSFGPYMTATDECMMSWRSDEYAGTRLQADEVTPFSDFYNKWQIYYKGIRKANTVFQRVDECKDLANVDKRDILGLSHFLRGYFYFHLLQLYGPIPLVPEIPMDVNTDLENLCFERNTYDECVDYICKDMEMAYQYLNDTRVSTQFKRPTRYAAMAVISRIRLYQASPWYNGNTVYSDWKTSDGRPFVSQTPDEKKWALSAIASLKIINSGKYSLHILPADANTKGIAPNVPTADFPNGAGGIDPYRSYAEMFNGESQDIKNPEIIYPATLSSSALRIAMPVDQGGWNGCGVTQVLIDAYRMRDGSDYVQQEDDYKAMTGKEEFSGYILNGGQLNGGAPEVAQMYANREFRFYATIGFTGCVWDGSSIDAGKEAGRNKLTVKYFKGANGYKIGTNLEDYNLTGYTCKKYVHPEDNFYRTGTVKTKTFPAIRYAEVLMNYAEALNELTTSYTIDDLTVARDPEEIMKYFNMIRYRAGLPGMTPTEAADPATVRQLIRRERMVEFAHEGRRYHDVRRWGIAMDTENAPVRGLNVELNVTNNEQRKVYYQPVTIDHKYAQRKFTQKMYFYPIPRTMLDLNPRLVQNPGW